MWVHSRLRGTFKLLTGSLSARRLEISARNAQYSENGTTWHGPEICDAVTTHVPGPVDATTSAVCCVREASVGEDIK